VGCVCSALVPQSCGRHTKRTFQFPLVLRLDNGLLLYARPELPKQHCSDLHEDLRVHLHPIPATRVRARRIHRRRRRSYRHLHSSRKSIEHGFGIVPQSELMPSDSPLTTLWESSRFKRNGQCSNGSHGNCGPGIIGNDRAKRPPRCRYRPSVVIAARCLLRSSLASYFNGLRWLWSGGAQLAQGIVAQNVVMIRTPAVRVAPASCWLAIIVLTAAHCTSDATELTVYRSTEAGAQSYQVIAVAAHPQYDAQGYAKLSSCSRSCVAEACVAALRSSGRLRCAIACRFLASDSSSLGLGTPRPDLQPGLARCRPRPLAPLANLHHCSCGSRTPQAMAALSQASVPAR